MSPAPHGYPSSGKPIEQLPRVPAGPASGARRPTADGVHDELARLRARYDAAQREIGRLRRADRSRGGCCRDEAAQAWAANDVLHDRLLAALAKADQWSDAADRINSQLVDALQEVADLRAELANRPLPHITVHNPPQPEPALLWRLRRRNR